MEYSPGLSLPPQYPVARLNCGHFLKKLPFHSALFNHDNGTVKHMVPVYRLLQFGGFYSSLRLLSTAYSGW